MKQTHLSRSSPSGVAWEFTLNDRIYASPSDKMHTHSLTSQTRCCLSEGMSACAGKVTGGLCAPRTSYMWGRLQRDPHEVHSLTCGAAGANKGAQVTNSHALLGSLCPYPRHEPRSEFPGAQRYTPWGGIGAGPSAAAASTCSQ